MVKLFTTPSIESRDAVANEIFGNVLAREFNLPVPDAALIDFDADFVSTLTDQKIIEILGEKDGRLKFGSELKEGYLHFDYTAYTLNDARKIIDIDSVYAFDNLIRNRDRNGLRKPNILIKSSTAFLIDHELGFEKISADLIKDLKNWQWDRDFNNYHIFYTFLKQSPIKVKKEYFNEFQEYLRLLNVNILDIYFKQLEQNGFSTKNHALIIEYLREMRQNSSKFVDNLKAIIS